jgi:4-alpha-glucanotransferase
LGLFRLWWIPKGKGPAAGTYVTYDHEALANLLVLEAFRAGALVVGEDLGVVAPGVREYLAGRGLLGTTIAWFEQKQDKKVPPADYRRLSMTTLTTHDLPPTQSYLAGEHIKMRDRLGMLDQPLAEAQAFYRKDRETMIELLMENGLLTGEQSTDDFQIVLALHRLLRATPSALLGVSLTDLTGDRRSQNLPGTDREYPNWCVPLTNSEGQPVFLENLEQQAPFQAITQVMQEP